MGKNCDLLLGAFGLNCKNTTHATFFAQTKFDWYHGSSVPYKPVATTRPAWSNPGGFCAFNRQSSFPTDIDPQTVGIQSTGEMAKKCEQLSHPPTSRDLRTSFGRKHQTISSQPDAYCGLKTGNAGLKLRFEQIGEEFIENQEKS